MAARTGKKPPAPAKCPACNGTGQTTETVRVGARKKQETGHKQTVMCLDCLGTGAKP
ncbi:hypothetical protein SLNWT_3623 [Streptomyces albus]|uniref:Molecular chaperone DnaJ n=1 Tax=Streptomyces albus (strain ATCC 21838 / DSM 41398 / FERM P-419 / JCM 4703 / NBRC 107858) TaxID=1081613 RepID=A0A0B5EQX2_STRA4|nr:hypothetical protein SLNWT_3623 [Streptomyces albus]AOU78303.1 hypothetical protein SLNHY_3612 [Streptomyces albus]AYN34054.1 hypothetical protein DUI70_3553 [Streptomyces albus]